MVEEMDDAAGQLVRRSCRLQKIGYDIMRAPTLVWETESLTMSQGLEPTT